MKEIAEQFLEPEAKTLAQRYQPLLSREDARKNEAYEDVRKQRLVEIQEIKKKLRDFSGIDLRNFTDVDEEQERELIKEQEEQRQVELPAPLPAFEPLLHDDVIEFARFGKIKANSEAFIPAFETFATSSVGRQESYVLSQFRQGLLATREFARCVDSQGSPR
jgi:hypothetical protein